MADAADDQKNESVTYTDSNGDQKSAPASPSWFQSTLEGFKTTHDRIKINQAREAAQNHAAGPWNKYQK